MTRLEKAEVFEKKLRNIRWIAVGAAVLQKGTAWLGAGTLTWATVVLMGGFASQMLISDFKWITVLVVLIVALLALSLFSINLITKKTLSIGSINPVRFTYRDGRRFVVTVIELVFLFFQIVLISVCLWKGFTSIHRSDFKSVHFYSFLLNSAPASSSSSSSNPDPAAPLQLCLEKYCFPLASSSSPASMAATCAKVCLDSASSNNNNLQICLYSFFLLLNSTSICAAVCLVYGWIVKLWLWLVGDSKCLSLRRYHDEVLSRAMNLGLAEADHFDTRVFLLRALGEDLMMRNIGPLEVRRQNLEVIVYLYNHPQGAEMVYQGLGSEDTLLQQAAANIVGFWSKSYLGLDRQWELLCRMGDKLGLPGKAAEGAANSFSALAKQWALGTKPNEETEPISLTPAEGAANKARWALWRSKAKPIEETKLKIDPIEPSPLLHVWVSQSRAPAGRGGGAAAGADGAAAGGEAAVRGAGGGAAPRPADDSTAGGVAETVPASDDAAAVVAAYDAAAKGGEAMISHGYNVVDKVIDLILQKLTPTLLIYVRALDSFFLSASVREHVSKTGRQKGLEEKLKGIIESKSDGMQPRTRLIAFFVLCRLRSSDHGTQIAEEDKRSMEELLKSVDEKFNDHLGIEAAGKKIIWFEESERYKNICKQLQKPHGAWLGHALVNGKDLVAPGPEAVKNSSSNGGVVNKPSSV